MKLKRIHVWRQEITIFSLSLSVYNFNAIDSSPPLSQTRGKLACFPPLTEEINPLIEFIPRRGVPRGLRGFNGRFGARRRGGNCRSGRGAVRSRGAKGTLNDTNVALVARRVATIFSLSTIDPSSSRSSRSRCTPDSLQARTFLLFTAQVRHASRLRSSERAKCNCKTSHRATPLYNLAPTLTVIFPGGATRYQVTLDQDVR